jgi:hypothetical protein
MELGDHLPVIQLVSFSTVSKGILYHYSWRISSSYLRDYGRGNPLLTLLSKTDSGWMIFMSGDCAGQGKCWSASSWSPNQDWTHLVVCMGKPSTWRKWSLLGTTSGP